jgi:hypothetical protein
MTKRKVATKQIGATAKSKPEQMRDEFKALLAKYGCEVKLSYSVSSDDKVGWTLDFKEVPKNAGQ